MRHKTILTAAGLLAVLIAAPAAAQRPNLGLHVGYNFDREDALLGAQVALPMGDRVDLYPSLNYYLTDVGSTVGFNVDVRLRNVLDVDDRDAMFYVGGGLNMMRNSQDGSSDTDTGGNLFVGYESRAGDLWPFVEVRGLLNENSAVQILGGLNFRLN
jgi:hypothetical protein